MSARPGHAQAPSPRPRAVQPAPSDSLESRALPPARQLRARGEWLQASGGAIGRHALPSLAADVSRGLTGGPLAGFSVEAGWLRAARPTTTAQGLTLGLARPLPAGPFTIRPGVAALAGQAVATADSGGYDWRGINVPYLGQTGYQDRPRLTRGVTAGVGLQLGADLPVARGFRLAGSVRQWRFSSNIVRANRAPLLAGFGLVYDRGTRRSDHAVADHAVTPRHATVPFAAALAGRADTSRVSSNVARGTRDEVPQ